MSNSISVTVVRVFTDADGRFGNPLGIVDAKDVAPHDRQELARQLGFSETVFVDVPDAPGETVDVRIYTPAVELPFAGHPTVGVASWLATRGTPAAALAVDAGLVVVRNDGDVTLVRAKAQWAPEFEFQRVDSPADVDKADPTGYDSGHHYVWAWIDEARGALRSRMFAPDMGVFEDEATGAAAVRITALLQRDLDITQGRGSRIATTVGEDGWIELGGRVVTDQPIETAISRPSCTPADSGR